MKIVRMKEVLRNRRDIEQSMKKFLFILCWVMANDAFGQATIKGLVQDSSARALEGATIELFKKGDTVPLRQVLTDATGNYLFTNIVKGLYTVKGNMVGHRPGFSSTFIVDTASDFNVGVLQLIPENMGLQSVTVTALQPPIEAKDGKIIYNIEKSVTTQGTTAFDQVRRTPGITVDGEDNLTLKGSSAVTIMIDGKLTYLGGQQLSNFLKSLPAENLLRIEVMTTPSAQYDATGNAGIINIVTKKSNRQGYALNLRAGAGTGQFAQSTNGVVGNICTNAFNFFGGYTYNYNHTQLERTSYRTISNGGKVVNYDRRSIDPAIANNHSFKAGADWYLNKGTTIGAVYNGTRNRWTRTGEGPTYLRNASGEADSLAINRNYTDQPATSAAYNLNILTQFDTLGTQLSADADYAVYQNESNGYLDNGVYSVDGSLIQPFQSLQFQQPGNVTIRSFKTDFVIPRRNWTGKAGAKYAFVTTDNNFRFDSLLNGSYVFSNELSNHFVYDEKVTAAYASIATTLTKTLTLDAGLRIEHTASSGDLRNRATVNRRNYANWFPYLSFTKNVSENHTLAFAVSRRINRPQYANLNPSRYFFDKYSYYQGNPFLQPELAWNGSVTFTLKQAYFATLTYSRTDNAILGFATQDSLSGVLQVVDRNFSYKSSADLLLVASFRPLPIWSVQSTANIIYVNYQFFDGKNYFRPQRVNVDLQLAQTFSLPKGFTAELTAFYTSPSINGIYLLRRYFQTDIGLRKTFASKLDVVLTGKDIFWTNRYWAYSIYGPTNIRYDHRPDSRRINLALTYRIGGKLSAGKDRSLEEQQRL